MGRPAEITRCTVELVSVVLVVIGALAWGLLATANFNIFDWVFGRAQKMDLLKKIAMIVIAIAGFYLIFDPRTYACARTLLATK